MIRNITFESRSVGVSPTAEPEQTILRTRSITVSPAEEFHLRDGQTRPISNDLAAAILSFKGRAQIANKGVIVDRKDIGGRFVYFHEHSVTLNDFASRERRLFYVVNRQTPEVLHLLDEAGCYLESLPLRERPAVLDNEAQAEQLRQHKSVINRAASRLQALHGEDTREALQTLAENSREMQRIVQTLPTSCTAPAQEPQPSRNGSAETIAEVTRQTSIRVSEERETARQHQRNRASSLALGRALTMNRRDPIPSGPAEDAEDWSESPTRNPQPQTPIELW